MKKSLVLALCGLLTVGIVLPSVGIFLAYLDQETTPKKIELQHDDTLVPGEKGKLHPIAYSGAGRALSDASFAFSSSDPATLAFPDPSEGSFEVSRTAEEGSLVQIEVATGGLSTSFVVEIEKGVATLAAASLSSEELVYGHEYPLSFVSYPQEFDLEDIEIGVVGSETDYREFASINERGGAFYLEPRGLGNVELSFTSKIDPKETTTLSFSSSFSCLDLPA